MAVLSGIGALGLPGLGMSFLADQLTNKTYGLEGLPPPDAAKPGEPQTFAGQAFAAGKQAIGDFYNAAKEAIGDLADFLTPEQAKVVANATPAEQEQIKQDLGVSPPSIAAQEKLVDIFSMGTTPAPVDSVEAQAAQDTQSLGLASLGTPDELSGVPMSGTVPSRTLGSLVDALPDAPSLDMQSIPGFTQDALTGSQIPGTQFSGGFGSGDGPDERIGDGPPPDTDNPYFYDPTTTGGYYDYGTFGPYDDRVVIPTEEVLKERFNLVI